jgi:A/G-specific adenine glycosylase
VNSNLLAWYRSKRRDMPWRRNVSPYRTWISEIMLQQTTVATVIPYFERFLKRFPDIKSLAGASESEVLSAWAGLGYYSRARNLRKAAQKITGEYAGKFPAEFDQVLELPGIGRYTAGAILSIAFGKPYPVLDGNVMRVFSRFFGIRDDIKKAETSRRMWGLAEKSLDRRHPGDWNQALMELGATVCLPEDPRCGACPVSRRCVAFKTGSQHELPVMPKRREPMDLSWTCLRIENKDRVLLWRRSSGERFLKDLWGLPESRHIKTPPGRLIKKIQHSITHHRIAVEVRQAAAPKLLPPQAAWVPRSKLKDFLVSSLWTKCAL